MNTERSVGKKVFLVVVIIIVVCVGIGLYWAYSQLEHGQQTQARPAHTSKPTKQSTNNADKKPTPSAQTKAHDSDNAIPLVNKNQYPGLRLKEEKKLSAKPIELSNMTLTFQTRRDFTGLEGQTDYPDRDGAIVLDVDIKNKTSAPLPTLTATVMLLRYDEQTYHDSHGFKYFDQKYLPYQSEIPAGNTVRKVFIFPMYSTVLTDERTNVVIDDLLSSNTQKVIALKDL